MLLEGGDENAAGEEAVQSKPRVAHFADDVSVALVKTANDGILAKPHLM